MAALVSLHLKSTSTFVVYLKNLIVADIVLTIMIPVKIAGDLPGNWEAMSIPTCRFFSVIFYNTQYTCIALLGFISLDRFFKIMMPRTTFAQNLTVSKVIAGSIWVIMFGVTGLPNIILTNRTVPTTQISGCMILKSPAGIRNSGSNNSQGKQKVKLRVFLVIIVFFVSFGPYHIVRIPYTFQQVSSSSTTTCSQIDIQIKLAKELTHWLSTTNICMDPLLYVFLCREFKEQLMALMKKVNRWI
ncbi:P2Y purinoceptor 13-like [Oryzias melastigma]|uniref:P2Y purinoceptor 13-like n=1 Tax=Oryzias melastigma TaxID=30732 RepID=UPI000CF809A2|nr:P2Y purinoceptor 13-like [Oryzias melastigma]